MHGHLLPRSFVLALVVMGLLLPVVSARADLESDKRECFQFPNTRAKIAACRRLIESGHFNSITHTTAVLRRSDIEKPSPHQMGVYWALGPDRCTVIGLPVVQVIQKPIHGTVRIIRPSFVDHDCRDKPTTIRATEVVYTPRKGYVGTDSYLLRVIYPNRKLPMIHMRILRLIPLGTKPTPRPARRRQPEAMEERPNGGSSGRGLRKTQPRCRDVGGYEAYMKRTGKVCRIN